MSAPIISGRGGGGSQDRARGHYLTVEYNYGGGGGGGVYFGSIQPAEGGCCPLLADSASGGLRTYVPRDTMHTLSV